MDKILKVISLRDSRDINKIGAWLDTKEFFKENAAERIIRTDFAAEPYFEATEL